MSCDVVLKVLRCRKKHEKEGTDELKKHAKEEKRRGLVEEIVKVRARRKDREDEREEMERLKQEVGADITLHVLTV